ncbi:caspase family protein [Haliscomenobacter hydrossis]|uniref:Peptidase C14 caspase catalytic subunit p20 n=1 Tax=Haliscomenobacter hydrossis (strain ATCC 27775 / DSM 1100 / LMG 10767 / O) TaxID=760192 RepID=F4L1S3_HALH1|nr:caspase family protein [Haliscomenobacter hydrossis]AEE49582.1 peptidase C14 caspase catalytic subunit p20 [Haliscomenobacter hydrossis DSM 1100]
MTKLHLLQIAINDYDPKSKVRSLRGCIKDADTFFVFLKEHYKHIFDPEDKDNKPLRLENDEATRANVIKKVKTLASRAKAGDFVIIQFAGHGSQSLSAIEFRDHPNTLKYDESLLLYDSRLPDGYDLADKEIAKLLAAFDEKVDLIFIADCCHAGTITREGEDEEMLARYEPARSGEPRPLSSYYGYDDPRNLQLPESNHIAITACEGKEKAFEQGQGVFTNALIEELTASERNASYAELFERVRTRVNQFSTAQTPQFDVSGNFNANRIFLSRDEKTANTYQVVRDSSTQQWKLMLGAVHGLSDDMKISVAIRPADHQNKPAKMARVKAVRMAHCLLEGFDADDYTIPYRAAIASVLKPSIKFNLLGDKQLCQQFKDQYHPDTPFFTVGFFVDAEYDIKLQTGKLGYSAELYQVSTGKIIHLIPGIKQFEQFMQQVASALQLVEKWERLLAVQSNHHTPNDNFEWYIDVDGDVHHEDQFSVELAQDAEKKVIAVPFDIWVKNSDQSPLYFTLLQFNRNYSIFAYRSAAEVGPGNLYKLRYSSFTIKGDALESKLIFKIIVSRKQLDQAQFEQKNHLNLGDLTSTRDSDDYENRGSNFNPDQEAWYTANKEVRIVRKM